jgi:hypothetical protein
VTFAQYLTGVLSIPVLLVSALYLLRGTGLVRISSVAPLLSRFGSRRPNGDGRLHRTGVRKIPSPVCRMR